MARTAAAAALLCASAAVLPASGAAAAGELRDALLVGSSAAGTVTFLDGHTFATLGTFNVVPDLAARLAEINANPVTAIAYAAVKHQEGGDRFADDIYLSPDGSTLYVSRCGLAGTGRPVLVPVHDCPQDGVPVCGCLHVGLAREQVVPAGSGAVDCGHVQPVLAVPTPPRDCQRLTHPNTSRVSPRTVKDQTAEVTERRPDVTDWT
jgi:hypothetical protein